MKCRVCERLMSQWDRSYKDSDGAKYFKMIDGVRYIFCSPDCSLKWYQDNEKSV